MDKSFQFCYLQAIKKAHDNFLVLGQLRKKKIENKRKTYMLNV